MVILPKPWKLEKDSTIKGGNLLFEFSNLTYQGFLDSRSHSHHKHYREMLDFSAMNFFGDRQLFKVGFEQLLMQGLKDKSLSLIQVSQLLSIRAGEYDTVGVFYDASTSAYQIMSILCNDAFCVVWPMCFPIAVAKRKTSTVMC